MCVRHEMNSAMLINSFPFPTKVDINLFDVFHFVFWVMMPCGVPVRSQRFGVLLLPLGLNWRQQISPKRWCPTATLQGVITQKTST
jgi:hypothetical protein